MLKENSKLVLNYVKENGENNITAKDIAAGTGLTDKQVNGIVTSAFQRKGYMTRVESEIELEDGTHKTVKFIKMTDEGLAKDFDAEDAE